MSSVQSSSLTICDDVAEDSAMIVSADSDRIYPELLFVAVAPHLFNCNIPFAISPIVAGYSIERQPTLRLTDAYNAFNCNIPFAISPIVAGYPIERQPTLRLTDAYNAPIACQQISDMTENEPATEADIFQSPLPEKFFQIVEKTKKEFGEKIQKLQAEIDAKKIVVNSAKQLEKDIIIQKQLKVISGLSQEMLDLNESERFIDPVFLEMAESLFCNDATFISASGVEHSAREVNNEPEALIKVEAKAIEKDVPQTETETLLTKDRNLSPCLTSDSKMASESRSIFHSITHDTEDTTSDVISEKISELEIISENILSKTLESVESAEFDKSYQYNHDFDCDEESSSKLPIIPASLSKKAFPEKEIPKFFFKKDFEDPLTILMKENSIRSRIDAFYLAQSELLLIWTSLDKNSRVCQQIDGKAISYAEFKFVAREVSDKASWLFKPEVFLSLPKSDTGCISIQLLYEFVILANDLLRTLLYLPKYSKKFEGFITADELQEYFEDTIPHLNLKPQNESFRKFYICKYVGHPSA